VTKVLEDDERPEVDAGDGEDDSDPSPRASEPESEPPTPIKRRKSA
jgi:hypothetical protein